MIDIIKRSGLLIPTEYKNEPFYNQIKEDLARRTKEYNNSTYSYNIFYLESDSFLLIPRNYPLQQYGQFRLTNEQHEGKDIDIEHNITPRSAAQQRVMSHMMLNNDGILQLAPGVGKTVIAIYMIAERKKKSLILVHRDSLAEQWRNRLLEFTNIHPENIIRLGSSSFEFDLELAHVVISTTQTFISLLKRHRQQFLTCLNLANIGIFVADEVHTSVGAPTFSECSIHMPSKYTYGLSATPYRYDGNGDVIEHHLGKIFVDDDIEGTMDAKVTVLLLDYQIDTPHRHKYIWWGGDFQRARYLNMIRKSKPYTTAIRGLLARLKEDRDLICIVERIKQIEDLYDWIDSDSKSKFCGSAKLDTLDSKVTFATPGKCRDGIDAPHKDCIIMTSPISNIEQLTGRVIRTNENKQSPIIIDMVDYGSRRMSSTFSNRKKFYDQKGWDIQYLLYVENKGIRQIDFNTAQRIITNEA